MENFSSLQEIEYLTYAYIMYGKVKVYPRNQKQQIHGLGLLPAPCVL